MLALAYPFIDKRVLIIVDIDILGGQEIIERWCTDRERAVLVRPRLGPAVTAKALGDGLAGLLARNLPGHGSYLDQEQAMQELVGCYVSVMKATPPLSASNALRSRSAVAA